MMTLLLLPGQELYVFLNSMVRGVVIMLVSEWPSSDSTTMESESSDEIRMGENKKS